MNILSRWRGRREERRVEAIVAKLSPEAKSFLLEHRDKLCAGWAFDAEGNWYPPKQ